MHRIDFISYLDFDEFGTNIDKNYTAHTISNDVHTNKYYTGHNSRDKGTKPNGKEDYKQINYYTFIKLIDNF